MANKSCPANSKKTGSEYVAFDTNEGNKVVASGSNVGTVIDNARRKGVEVPAVLFVPQEGVTYIY